jgi:S-adenosylmethionine synthetase
MSLEAYAGKNPVTHVGKLYAACGMRVARACVRLPRVRAAECFLVSQIGSPITELQVAGIRLDAPPDVAAGAIATVREIVSRELNALPTTWKEILFGSP